MIKKWFLLCYAIGVAVFAQAQNSDLVVQGIAPNLHLVHSVQPKETWYAIGRLYNISAKELAAYNKLGADKSLSVGQVLNVPLNAENFSQDGSKASDEVFVPIHHVIQEKEWLYRISVNYNKVPIDNLEKWNGINKDQAKAGLPIIIGYLKVKTGQSALASKGQSKIVAASPVATAVATAPPVKQDVAVQKPAPQTTETEPAKTPTPAGTVPPKEEQHTMVTAVVNNTTSGGNRSKLSFFGAQYEETGKSMSGNAGIFKSTSGWNDGKYYALVNNVPVGTIVKINNPVSGKTIFAKVLGSLPDMKESMGLIARVSDAGAAQIEATDVKFSVELRY